MRICLLGELTVADGEIVAGPRDFPRRQMRLVLAYLATTRDRLTPTSELADLLWPDRPPVEWTGDVSAVVSKLRARLRALGFDSDEVLPVVPGGHRLVLGARGAVDVDEVASLVSTARGWLTDGRCALASEATDRATEQLRTGFLPAERGPWVEARREEIARLRADALAVATEAALLSGDEVAARLRAAELAELEPYEERAVRLQMRSHLLAGERAMAMAAYERCRRRLRSELGVHPSAETEAVYLEALGVGEPMPALPVPARMVPSADELPLVGRAAEIGALSAALDATGPEPRFVAVRGEAGVGKTRTIAEFARVVHGRGTTVFAGRCDEEIRLPFAPLVDALDPLLHAGSAEWLAAACGAAGTELCRLWPSIRARLPGLAEPLPSAPGIERLRLLDAVRTLLERLSRDQPLTLVVDDLQWVDPSTLMLIRHVMRTAAPLPVLVVGTIRDGEATAAIDHLLADLTAEGRVTTIRLAGLTCPEVAALLGDDAHAEAMHELTAGNPLYLRELMKAGVGANQGEPMPTSIVDVICRRAGRLSATGQQLLAAAAISGLRFNLATIADAVGLDLGRATTAADEAARHGLISASLDDPVRDLEFVHPLVRRSLGESMTDARRGLLHHLIGHAVERRHGDDGRYAAELYVHYAGSCETTDRRRAVAAARRASAHAAEHLGYDESVAHATAALTLFDLLGGPESDRAWLVVELADARRAIADLAAAATYRDAARLARSTDAPAVLARAALGLTDAWAFSGEVIDDRREILDEALDVLGDDEPALRARVAARLASELYYVAGSLERRRELCDHAVAVARTVNDHLAIAAALDARSYATWGLGGAAERLGCGQEIAGLADRARSPELTLAGLGWCITASLELGDIAASRRALASYQQLADQLRQPRYIWYALTREAMLHHLAGDHEHALATATRALTVGAGEADHDNVHHALLAQMTIFRRATHDVPALVERADTLERQLGPANPSTRYVTAVAAAAAAEAGATDQSRTLLQRLPADWIDTDDLVSAATLAAAAWAVTRTHDGGLAGAIGERLTPLRGTHLVAAGAVVYWGAASHWLGELAATVGDRATAAELLHQALAEHHHVGSRPFEQRTQHAINLLGT